MDRGRRQKEFNYHEELVVPVTKTTEAMVTRKGQTTIPVGLREKYKIKRGSRLEVIDTGEGILLKPKVSISDLAGSRSKRATVKQVKQLLDRMRSEDV